jgi:hypothetical protein
MLECWNAGITKIILGCWNAGMLGCWNKTEYIILECWDAGMLGYWNAGMKQDAGMLELKDIWYKKC